MTKVSRPRDFIPRTLSARIILQTVLLVTIPLATTVLAITIGTRLIIREETGRRVNQALDGIAYRIDNTLLCVEQTAAIIHDALPNFLDKPNALLALCQEALESNPNIAGCAIALNPELYLIRGKPFMAYVHRDHEEIVSLGTQPRPLITSQSFTSLPFTEQEWYAKPFREGVPSWVGPLKNAETETDPIISYDVPIVKGDVVTAVLGLDVPLSVLTEIVRNYQTSNRSVVSLLDKDGSYIVHPDSARLIRMDSLSDLVGTETPPVMEALREMVAGKSGKTRFTLDSASYYMAYMPFRQSAAPGRHIGNLGWSIAVMYPEDYLFDIFDPGFRMSIFIIIAGVLLLLAGAVVISRISLRPLRKLTYITRLISRGNYRLPGFETKRTDEVGRLQSQYNKMLEHVSDHMEQLQNLSRSEEASQKDLAAIYARTKEIRKHKNKFFNTMSRKMTDVTGEIQASADLIYESGGAMEEKKLTEILIAIEKEGLRVADILNEMLAEV